VSGSGGEADPRAAQIARDDEEPARLGRLDARPLRRVHPGDLWQLGAHRLLCGDSRNAADVLRLLDGHTPDRVDLVFADPPYGLSIVTRRGTVGGGGILGATIRRTAKRATPRASRLSQGTLGSGKIVPARRYGAMIGDESTQTAIAGFRLCQALFPRAVQIWWGGNFYAQALPPSRCWLVWDKQNTGRFADAELAWTNHNSAVRVFAHRWNGMIKASERGEPRVHPTQKPIALARWCFESYGKPGDVVFDPFVGSGITLLAGEETGRRVLGCEISADYCAAAIARWEARTGESVLLVGAR